MSWLQVRFPQGATVPSPFFVVCVTVLHTKLLLVASRRSGSLGRRRRPMERSMTFPGVVSVAVSGGEGQQKAKVLQARGQEVSFEALSMRPTEVSPIALVFTSVG